MLLPIRGLRWGIKHTQERKCFMRQLASSLQLYIPSTHNSALTTAASKSQTSKAPLFLNASTCTYQDGQYKGKLPFIRIAVGFGVGLFIGGKLKTYYDEKSKIDKSLHRLFPTVYAANPLSVPKPSDVDKSQDETKSVSKRMIYNFIADAVEKASDKVVYIDIKDSRRRRQYQSITNGSGFIISEDGLILTNAHLVTNRPRSSVVMVRLYNGLEYEGVVEEIDVISDLALIRINCGKLSPVRLGKSCDLRPGEFVAALGSPLSLSNSVTAGVVSSVGRCSKELGLKGKDIQYIQTDAAITFGNSGGPLINMDGEVIGINSMTVTSGISFAIPIDYAKEFIVKAEKKLSELSKYPESRTPDRRRYLGITMLTLTQNILLELQARGNAPQTSPTSITHGIFIWRVVVGSPAYQAGLQPGDIVTHINNHEIHSSRDVYKYLEERGDLSMTVIRNGQRYSVTVAPEE
ncbi:hypothetical protein Pmani_009247 [Petrolisthes manimaculis]|uniref:Serine protease HTRA2, mitochondrial n=1 Tax=Petrolisthes manimaculis TaxID=1843537 RepID=A0AAE1Q4P5_9EUCA|nr:hypothetical protein Pmani_009247 [Petrolisthes manimaculis]